LPANDPPNNEDLDNGHTPSEFDDTEMEQPSSDDDGGFGEHEPEPEIDLRKDSESSNLSVCC